MDIFLNPLSVLEAGQAGQTIQQAQLPVGAVSFRAQNFDAVNEVKYNSLDPYARARSVYYQQRQGLLEDRVAGMISEDASDANDDAFDSFYGE